MQEKPSHHRNSEQICREKRNEFAPKLARQAQQSPQGAQEQIRSQAQASREQESNQLQKANDMPTNFRKIGQRFRRRGVQSSAFQSCFDLAGCAVRSLAPVCNNVRPQPNTQGNQAHAHLPKREIAAHESTQER